MALASAWDGHLYPTAACLHILRSQPQGEIRIKTQARGMRKSENRILWVRLLELILHLLQDREQQGTTTEQRLPGDSYVVLCRVA